MYTELTISYIRNTLARTPVIYSRGETLYHLGGYTLSDHVSDPLQYRYTFDGTYGEYEIILSGIEKEGEVHLSSTCTCPYPHGGCKHIVAAHLDLSRRLKNASMPEYRSVEELLSDEGPEDLESLEVMTPEEIMESALE